MSCDPLRVVRPEESSMLSCGSGAAIAQIAKNRTPIDTRHNLEKLLQFILIGTPQNTSNVLQPCLAAHLRTHLESIERIGYVCIESLRNHLIVQ